MSNWYLRTRAMQNAADLAVIAAATNGSSNFRDEAKAVTAQYGFVDGANNVEVTALDTAPCPAEGSTCYSVTIKSVVPLYLSQVVGYTGDRTVNGAREKILSSEAIAQLAKVKQPICLLGLSQAAEAVRTNGAPNSNFSGCTVMSNSDATCNGSNLNATFGLAHGTNNGCGNTAISNVDIVKDPYETLKANIPTPNCPGSPPYPQETMQGSKWSGGTLWSGNKNLSGTVQMCGDVRLTGPVVINTTDSSTGAVLVIQNGRLDLNGWELRTAYGSAVTIVFSGTSGPYEHYPADNSNGGVLDIQAPSSGDFPGMAIYQDPRLTTGVDVTYKGNNPTWKISGGVYLPNSNVQISGNVSQSTNGANCFVMVANTILINGTSNIYQQTPNGAGCKLAGLDPLSATIPGRTKLVY